MLVLDLGLSDLERFSDIPILSHPVIKDNETGFKVILKLEKERIRRKKISDNDKRELDKLPYIICIIDEFPGLLSGISSRKNDECEQRVSIACNASVASAYEAQQNKASLAED